MLLLLLRETDNNNKNFEQEMIEFPKENTCQTFLKKWG